MAWIKPSPPDLPKPIALKPPPSEFEIFCAGLGASGEPILLLEMLQAEAAIATTRLPPESPSAAQNHQVSLVMTRTEKAPPGDLTVSLPVGAYLRPMHTVGDGSKQRLATYRKECDLMVREDCRLNWPVGQPTITWQNIPVLAVHAAPFYPSRDCRFQMEDGRADFVAMLFNQEFASHALDWRQMALSKAAGARVNASAYSNIFPRPDWKRMSPAERQLLDTVKQQSAPLGRELDIQRSNRPRDRRMLADRRRRVLVNIGGQWRLYFLLRSEPQRYFAARFFNQTYGVWFERDQIQLPEDFRRQRESLLQQAAEGVFSAQARIGAEYLVDYSLLVDRDYSQALRWSLPAAEGGNLVACRSMYLLAANGWGMEKQPTQAVAWARKGAEGGDTELQARLASHLSDGVGVPADYAEAFRWAKQSFESHDRWGQFVYGRMLVQGKAVPANLEEGQKWIFVAAQRGCPEASAYVRQQLITQGVMLAAAAILQNGFSGGDVTARDDDHSQDWDVLYEQQMGQLSMEGKVDPVTWEPR
ncbi:MAG: tetratricopeptide repeat protein [Pirellulales bacterium]